MNMGFEHLEEEDCADHDTSIYVKNVVDALKLGSGEILLAVAFVTADGRKYHQMFPRVMGVDVKYGTNNERRPLLRLVGRTGSNKIFSIMNCYMPSEQQYAFAWAFGTALQHCLDKDALSLTEIILSDEDKDQLAAIDGVLKRGDFGPHAVVRFCKWHLVRITYCVYFICPS